MGRERMAQWRWLPRRFDGDSGGLYHMSTTYLTRRRRRSQPADLRERWLDQGQRDFHQRARMIRDCAYQQRNRPRTAPMSGPIITTILVVGGHRRSPADGHKGRSLQLAAPGPGGTFVRSRDAPQRADLLPFDRSAVLTGCSEPVEPREERHFCRPPAGWDHPSASGMGPGPESSASAGPMMATVRAGVKCACAASVLRRC